MHRVWFDPHRLSRVRSAPRWGEGRAPKEARRETQESLGAFAVTTAPQRRIYRAVSGAVRNVRVAHPEWGICPQAEKSIAKRAAGTLSSQWPEVLAARPSDRRQVDASHARRPAGGKVATAAHLPPFSARVFAKISALVGPAKRSGKTERVETLIEVLRLVDALRDRK